MTPRYTEHPEATDELLDAIRYYHGVCLGFGDDLADNVRAAVQEILDSPAAWPPIPEWDEEPLLRGRKVGVYPYRVVYYVRRGEVIVIAYAHEKRRPGYWQHRVTG